MASSVLVLDAAADAAAGVEGAQNYGQGDLLVVDLVGLDVYLGEPPAFGKVVGVVLVEDIFPNLPKGAGHDFLEIEFRPGAGVRKRLLVPIVRAHVAKIEKRGTDDGKSGGGVWITPPKGMLELATVHKEKVTIRALFGPSKMMLAAAKAASNRTENC